MSNIQDWTPVVFKKTTNKTKQPTIQHAAKPVKLDENDEVVQVKKVSKEMASAVQTARLAKDLTQNDLAKLTNLPSKVINDIERGGSLYNANHFNMICTKLKIQIPRNFD
jgi:ribosome-binding protein aMBF1 (putative translation factor)